MQRKSERVILHLDFDSFFASVEQQYHPEFRGKPLGVTATNGRTCIIAASREAKRHGVKTGMNTYRSFVLCPSLLLTRANFNLYWEVSQKFISICKDFSPYIEIFSIDELFMDVTQTAFLFGGVEMLIKKIKQRIAIEIGEFITVSVGVSYNKLLAKLGSGMKKPDGVFYIKREDIEELYQQTDLLEICGIGPRILSRLNRMGIYTLTKLRKAPLLSLVAEFGNVEGHFLWNVGQGKNDELVRPYTALEKAKSVGRQYCLPENEYDERVILQNVYELCEEIALKLRRLKQKAKIIGINLKGSICVSAHKTSGIFMDTGKELFSECLSLMQNPASGFYTGIKEDRYVRRIGIWTGYLRDKNTLTPSLFSTQSKKENLIRTIDALNEKFGDHTIRNGFLLYADKLTTVPNGYGPGQYEIEQSEFFKLGS